MYSHAAVEVGSGSYLGENMTVSFDSGDDLIRVVRHGSTEDYDIEILREDILILSVEV